VTQHGANDGILFTLSWFSRFLLPCIIQHFSELTEESVSAMGIKQLEEYRDPYSGRMMTFGEIGCFLSHYKIWEQVSKHVFQMLLSWPRASLKYVFPTTHKVFGGGGVVLKFNIKRPKVGFRFECGEINLLEVSLYAILVMITSSSYI
jgi:hypothetical protein